MSNICISAIDWASFNWEAFATLITGILAVSAAYLIGRRQTKILDRQVELQDLALRSDLFDRRYSVYDRTRRFVVEIVRHAESPSGEFEQQFLVAMGEAKFLFDEIVISGLAEIWQKACAYQALKSNMKHIYSLEGHYGQDNPQKECDALIWFGERLEPLPGLFEEMKLAGKLV